jgi:hypothetical protein
MFQHSVIRYAVKLRVSECGRNVAEVVEARARKMLESVCSHVGIVKQGTLRLLQMGPGVLSGIDMGRHYTFQCMFEGEVCNPPPGTRVKGYVRSINRFGVLVEAGYLAPTGTLVPLVELVVVRDPTMSRNEIPLDGLSIGDEVFVEVLGRRFELRDTRITGYGRTVSGLEAVAAAAPNGIATNVRTLDLAGEDNDVEEASSADDDDLLAAQAQGKVATGERLDQVDQEEDDDMRSWASPEGPSEAGSEDEADDVAEAPGMDDPSS